MFQQHVEPLLLPQISHETLSASQQTLDNLSFYIHSNHRCGMHMKMSCVVINLVVLPLWLPPWSTLSSFYMSPHSNSSSHNLCNVCESSMYYFVFSLVLHLWYSSTKSALLASIVVMFSSHNISTSLCCCSVDHFIHVVIILRYDCTPVLNIVRKLSMVGICKPRTNF